MWRKAVRKPNDSPYYNISKDYIEYSVDSYLLDERSYGEIYYTPSNSNNIKEKEGGRKVISEDPGEYEYGGFWYKKGKESQKYLIQFYEKFGFIEDSSIYFNWNCFDPEEVLPTMRKVISCKYSNDT